MKRISLILLTIMILSGCSTVEEKKEESQPAMSTEQTTTVSTTESTSSSSSTHQSKESTTVEDGIESITMTVEDAKRIYDEQCPNSSITSIDIDRSFGTYYYKIEGVGDDMEYHIKINTSSSEVTKKKEKELDRDEQNGIERQQKAIDFSNLKSLKEAIAVAKPLLENAVVSDAELEKDDGITYWDLTLKKGLEELEVKIDAVSGSVLKTESH